MPSIFYFKNGGCNIGIRTATAYVSTHKFTYFCFIAGMTFTQAGNAAHDLPWCTIAALKSVMLNKGFLQRMQFTVVR